MDQTINITCPICLDTMKPKIRDWSFYCNRCDYWSSTLEPDIKNQNDSIFIENNEDDILFFLDSIRNKNFEIILSYISNTKSKIRILDNGCATGLFIEIASSKGHEILGIEPNPAMYQKVLKKGYNVVSGYFSDDIKEDSKFDVIIFNDVFEHIPKLSSIIEGCQKHLNESGYLVINLPNFSGIIFKIAKILATFGMDSPWNHLWQKMFFTLHLHYFNSSSLDLNLRKSNFYSINFRL